MGCGAGGGGAKSAAASGSFDFIPAAAERDDETDNVGLDKRLGRQKQLLHCELLLLAP